jgi:hypothetical protein
LKTPNAPISGQKILKKKENPDYSKFLKCLGVVNYNIFIVLYFRFPFHFYGFLSFEKKKDSSSQNFDKNFDYAYS